MNNEFVEKEDQAGGLLGEQIVGLEDEKNGEALRESKIGDLARLDSVGMLAAGVAHDLNNALTVIIGHLEMARSLGNKIAAPESGADRFLDSIGLAEEGCRRASATVQGLLARIKKKAPALREIDFTQSVREAVSFAEGARHENVEIDFQDSRSHLIVMGDSAELQQIILNLIMNSQKAMTGAGKIDVSCEVAHIEGERSRNARVAPGDYAVLKVADTGCGINSEDLGKVFEPLYTTRSDGGSVGLGLWMCQKTVKSWGGWIEVSSESGQGTVFELFFPLADSSRQADRARVGQVAGMPLVMLVDDDDMITELLSEYLRSQGYLVQAFNEGLPALKWFGDNLETVKAVLLDVHMPSMNGVEVFFALKRINPNVMVAVLSGDVQDTDVQTLLRSGVEKVFSKPLCLQSLSHWLEETVGAPVKDGVSM